MQEPPPPPSLNIKSIDLRSDYLKSLIEEEDLAYEERAALNSLLNAYNSVKIFLSRQLTKPQQDHIVRDLFNAVSILDYRYFSKKRIEITEEKQRKIAILADMKKKILESYIADDYKGVIAQCTELQRNFGEEGFSHEISLVYILSLGEEGRLTEAVNLGQEVLSQWEPLPDRMYLKSRIVQWDLALGNGESALNLYDKLTDELDSKEALVNNLRKKIVELDRPPAFNFGEESKVSTLPLESQETKSVHEVLNEANNLAQKREFKKAKLLLQSYKDKVTSPAELDMIERSIEVIELAEQESAEQAISRENRKKETITLAKKDIEKEEFEEAIARIDNLAAEGIQDRELQDLKEDAVEKYINNERNRAANLFLLAKKTNDPEEKKKYLTQSREILKKVIEKFPASKLNDRLKSHLNTIENELKKL